MPAQLTISFILSIYKLYFLVNYDTISLKTKRKKEKIMADSKIFKLIDGIDTDLIAHGIEGFLRDKKNLTTESLKTPEGWLIQAKQTDS